MLRLSFRLTAISRREVDLLANLRRIGIDEIGQAREPTRSASRALRRPS